jgi:hypothetical protein
MNTKQAALVSIDALLRQISEQSVKSAEAGTEAGGFTGSTTHPVKNEDDRTQPATEGARSKENTTDVKEQQGAPSVDSSSESTPSQDTVQYNIGTSQSATGEDSSVETDSAKSGKDDPGSDHPARTDNDSLDGHKFAQQILRLTEKAATQGNDLLALLAVEARGEIQKKAAELAAEKKVPVPPVEEQPEEGADKAAQAGYELAAIASGSTGNDKLAEAAGIVDAIAYTISDAFSMAEKTAAYLDEYFATLKRAEECAPCDEKKEDEKKDPNSDPTQGGSGDDSSTAAGPPDDGGDDSGSEGSPSEEELLNALLSGGEGMGAEDAASGMGGAPTADASALAGGTDATGGGMDAAMGGAAPAGGMDAAAGGAAPGAGGGEAEQLAMLQTILNQLGITPEQLQAASVGKQAEALIQQKKAGAAAKATWKPKTAEELKRYAATVDYVRELVGR